MIEDYIEELRARERNIQSGRYHHPLGDNPPDVNGNRSYAPWEKPTEPKYEQLSSGISQYRVYSWNDYYKNR